MTFFSLIKFGMYCNSIIFITDMNINHIFNLFGGDDKKYTEESPSTINMEQFEKTPTFKVGMFKKNYSESACISKETY